MKGSVRRAVFLDRDGVVIEDVDYLCRAGQLKLLAGAARAVVRLRRAGFKVVVATNQSGVARGYLTLAVLRRIHLRMKRFLAARGAKLDALYFCPHLPSRGCACRKPALGMLRQAEKRFSLDLKKSYFVGDSTTDILTARRAGCTAVLVRTGKSGRDGLHRVRAHKTCRDLAAAAAWIVGRERGAGAL